MIILEKPYVSDFLIETIKKNNYSVLDNEISRKYFSDCLLNNEQAKSTAPKEGIYSNSENSIDWVDKNLKNSSLNKMIELSKNKVLFRKALKKIYPSYNFEEVQVDKIKDFDISKFNFPLILKPSVGFLSFGVYPVKSIEEWNNTILNLEDDIEKFKNIFPKNVVDTTTFIIEDMIEGDEYALDAYFDENSKGVILNIFSHPFFDDKDVSDRAYYTSKKIIRENLEDFSTLIDKIGKICGYKNFPFHLELRKYKDKIIPIELNPMRFCGWCITDIAYFCYGINVYEYYFKKLKPNWDEILKDKDDEYYYFTIGDIPSSIDKNKIKAIDYEKYLKNIKEPLDIRKIDYKNNPIFAIVFAKTSNIDEIKNILRLDMREFIL